MHGVTSAHRRARAEHVLLILADDLTSSDVGALRRLHAPALANSTWSGATRGLTGCEWTAKWSCDTDVHLPSLAARCCCAHRDDAAKLATCMRSPFASAGFAGLPTPALDRLAREGTVLSHAYSPHALCAPARAALLTGRLVSEAGTADVDQAAAADATRGAATIASHLLSRGFRTGFFGKWHLATLPLALRAACDSGGIQEWNASVYESVRQSVLAAGFDVADALYPCNLPSKPDPPHSHNAEWILEHALRFVEASLAQRRRYFAMVALTIPHGPHPLHALRMPLGRLPTGAQREEPGWPSARAQKMRRAARSWVERTLTKTLGFGGDLLDARTSLASGLLWLDRSVHSLLEAVDALNQSERTLTVFTADHAREGKWTCNGPGVQVPMLLRWPAVLSAGAVRPWLVSHVDLLPTLLDAVSSSQPRPFTGAEPPPMDGRSVLSTWLGTRAERTYATCEMYTDRAVMSTPRGSRGEDTSEYTLVWRGADPHRVVARPSAWADAANASRQSVFTAPRADVPASWSHALQLYRVSGDPHERVNLAADPAHRGKLEALRNVLWAAYPQTRPMAWLPEYFRVTDQQKLH